jgi:hypothetical protein
MAEENRMRIELLVLTVCLTGCSGDSDTGGDGMSDDPTTPGDDDDTTAEACVVLREGAWAASGTCFGHEMTATLTLTEDGCAFTFSDWNMAMSTPTGGSVDDADVSLTGTDWNECQGTTTGTSMTGLCSDGCEFALAAE